MEYIENKIFRKIKRADRGRLFFLDSFAKFGNPKAVNKALDRFSTIVSEEYSNKPRMEELQKRINMVLPEIVWKDILRVPLSTAKKPLVVLPGIVWKDILREPLSTAKKPLVVLLASRRDASLGRKSIIPPYPASRRDATMPIEKVASLRDAGVEVYCAVSTERCIPTGCEQNDKRFPGCGSDTHKISFHTNNGRTINISE
ncbi:hypothetical protein AGMMS49982_19760 [Bacteroidia bacterium]|nr:hypothetical protein AGMMS49982_19760 [Bacteroidia bacterium]